MKKRSNRTNKKLKCTKQYVDILTYGCELSILSEKNERKDRIINSWFREEQKLEYIEQR